MNNPENSRFKLNFSQLFQKTHIKDSYFKNGSITSRSDILNPSSNFTQRASNFIPKYPYGRAASVNCQRKNNQKGAEQQDLRIFSIRTLQGKSPRYINKSMNENRSKKSQIRIKLLNKSINLLKLEDQMTKNPNASLQTKMKIKGLKVRTGSQAKRNKQILQLDHNVVIKGKKLLMA